MLLAITASRVCLFRVSVHLTPVPDSDANINLFNFPPSSGLPLPPCEQLPMSTSLDLLPAPQRTGPASCTQHFLENCAFCCLEIALSDWVEPDGKLGGAGGGAGGLGTA